jgi:hypothetical protein
MQCCSYLVAIQFAQCSTKLSCRSADLINVEILALAQPDDSDYSRRQLPKSVHNANFLKLALNLTSINETANGSIQSLIHSSGGGVQLFHPLKKVGYNGISFDLS